MATDSVLGIFADPFQIMQQQSAATDQRAAKFAEMDPMQRAQYGIYGGANRVAGGIAGAMGAQDPALQQQSAIQSVLKGVDQTDAKALRGAAQKLADLGFLQPASALAQRSVEIQAKIDEKQAQRASMEAIAQGRNETSLQIADLRAQMAQAKTDLQAQLIQAKIDKLQSTQGQGKLLAPSLQKSEDKDLELIDNYSSQVEALTPSINSLTPNDKGVAKLELGPVKNAMYAAKNAAGNSDETSRAYGALKSAVDTAVNLKVSAEKGVQTDKDVLRFANALIAAYGRNDTKATLEALQNYRDAMVKDQSKVKTRLESRRSSQGVNPYYVNDTATGGNNDPLGIRKK